MTPNLQRAFNQLWALVQGAPSLRVGPDVRHIDFEGRCRGLFSGMQAKISGNLIFLSPTHHIERVGTLLYGHQAGCQRPSARCRSPEP